IRIDKWLWAVRLFKTRTLAADACRGGHVRVNGEIAKPAREIRPGDVLSARTGDLTRTCKVLAVLEKRIGAALVPQYAEDQTPAAEYQRVRERAQNAAASRAPGAGRPTKRDRRQMQAWLDLPPPPPDV
ncbi:MAG: RNA-binding S4 domain-containing protein, partial [Verrucomicrobiales bacterium]|nr:RNA-binding S4 domain-containing protein [Verrucomicrobiales bacterium]